jgi:hypothetical protein
MPYQPEDFSNFVRNEQARAERKRQEEAARQQADEIERTRKQAEEQAQRTTLNNQLLQDSARVAAAASRQGLPENVARGKLWWVKTIGWYTLLEERVDHSSMGPGDDRRVVEVSDCTYVIGHVLLRNGGLYEVQSSGYKGLRKPQREGRVHVSTVQQLNEYRLELTKFMTDLAIQARP